MASIILGGALELIGAIILIIGFWLIWHPLAFITGGIIIILLAQGIQEKASK